MFVELEDVKTKLRLSINLDTVFAIVELPDGGGAVAVSVDGARLELPADYEEVRDAVAGEED